MDAAGGDLPDHEGDCPEQRPDRASVAMRLIGITVDCSAAWILLEEDTDLIPDGRVHGHSDETAPDSADLPRRERRKHEFAVAMHPLILLIRRSRHRVAVPALAEQGRPRTVNRWLRRGALRHRRYPTDRDLRRLCKCPGVIDFREGDIQGQHQSLRLRHNIDEVRLRL